MRSFFTFCVLFSFFFYEGWQWSSIQVYLLHTFLFTKFMRGLESFDLSRTWVNGSPRNMANATHFYQRTWCMCVYLGYITDRTSATQSSSVRCSSVLTWAALSSSVRCSSVLTWVRLRQAQSSAFLFSLCFI